MNRELPDIQDDTSLMAKSEEKPKSLLMTVKDESEKVGLNATLKKNKQTRIMATGPYRFMANRRGKVEAVTDFIFLGAKISVDGDCSHEINRCLLLEGKL